MKGIISGIIRIEDEKGVSPLIGFILMLLILMISISTLQSNYIPSISKEIEAEHMKSIASQFIELKDISSSTKTVKLDMGVDYPEYIFLITPKSIASTLNAEETQVEFTFTEILANGTELNRTLKFSSDRIELLPNYLYYPNDRLILENTAIFRYAGLKYVNVSHQSSFGDTIDFTMYNASFSSFSTVQPLSLVSVSSSMGGRVLARNVTVTFESVNPSYWANLDGYSVSVSGNNVSVTKNGTVLLAINRVNLYIGSDIASADTPSRIVKVNSLDSYSLGVGETLNLAVKVTDDYNNPVEGVLIDVASDIGAVSPSEIYSNEDGEAFVQYSSDIAGDGTVTFTCSNCSSVTGVSYEVSVSSGGSQGGNGSSSSSVSISLSSNPSAESVGNSNKTIYAFVSTGSEGLPGYLVRFSLNSSSGVELSSTDGLTNFSGFTSTVVSQNVSGSYWYRVYGYAGSVFDYIDVLLNVTPVLWIGQNGGNLQSCDSSGSCTNHGDKGDTIFSLAVYDNKLWLGHDNGDLSSCDSSGSCTNHGDKGNDIRAMAVFNNSLWIGQNGGNLQSCDSSGSCTNHGDKGDTIFSLAVYDNKLWLGHDNGDLSSCDSSGSCTNHGDKGNDIRAMAVFNNSLWIGQNGGNLQSCDSSGSCTNHGDKGNHIYTMAVFNNSLWIGQNGGNLQSCDSSGSCTNHGDKGDTIFSLAVYDNKLWLGHDNGDLSSCDSSGSCTNHGDKGNDIRAMALF